MARRGKFTAHAVLAAIRKARGNKTEAARLLETSWITIDNYCRRYPSIQAELHGLREGLIDNSEANVANAVANGDLQASQWVLRTIGKKRGWTERSEVVLSGDEANPITFREIEVHLPMQPTPEPIEEPNGRNETPPL